MIDDSRITSMDDDRTLPPIVRAAVLSSESAVNLHADGSMTLEVLNEGDIAFILLTASEVKQLMRFLAEML